MLKTIFGIDGSFTGFMEKTADFFLVSIMWIICSLPVVTIVLSTSALYYSVVKCVRRERGTATHEFIHFIKENWKQGLKLGVVYLILGTLVALNIYAVFQMERGSMLFRVYSIESLWIGICFLFASIYLFPLFSRFEYTTMENIKMSLFISWKHIFSSLLFSVIVALFGYLTVRFIFLLVIIPGLFVFIISFRMEKIMLKYMPEPKEGENLPWYYDEKSIVQNDEK